MLESIKWLGVPQSEINFITALYDNTMAVIKMGGMNSNKFEMTRGIRQGCPLSPIVFAIIVDILLRKLDKILGKDGTARAFADDTASITDNIFMNIRSIAKLFKDYEKISGLGLNLSKTLVIPLWDEREDVEADYRLLKEKLRLVGDGWEMVQVVRSGKYLGYRIGPDRKSGAWDKAEKKWEERSKAWASKGLGLQFSAMVYNTFCSSVLGFLGQLLNPPQTLLDKEERCMLRLASGPMHWACACDLWNMGPRFGIGKSFDCLLAKAQAAQLRALHFENWEKPIEEEERDLKRWVSNARYDDRLIWWNSWFKEAYPITLMNNKRSLEKLGITKEEITKHIQKHEEDKAVHEIVKKKFQKVATQWGMKNFGCDWEHRAVHKLKRWHIQGVRRRNTMSFNRNMAGIGSLVAPRVAASVWGLAWNRWTTARRFQKTDRCLLGCLDRCDSAEHYIGCPVARKVGWKKLRLAADNSYEERKKLWLATADWTNDREQTCWHLLVYAVFMTSNRRRSSREEGGEEDELKQWINNAVEGHLKSGRVVSSRWVV